MLKAMKADFEGRFAPFVQNGEMCACRLSYTDRDPEEAEEWKQEMHGNLCLVWKSIWIRCHLVWHAILDMVLLQSHVLRK